MLSLRITAPVQLVHHRAQLHAVGEEGILSYEAGTDVDYDADSSYSRSVCRVSRPCSRSS